MATKKSTTKSEVTKRSPETIIVRPRRKDQARTEFQIYIKGKFDLKQFKLLGLYSKDGKAEEWCHKEDFDYFMEMRKNDVD